MGYCVRQLQRSIDLHKLKTLPNTGVTMNQSTSMGATLLFLFATLKFKRCLRVSQIDSDKLAWPLVCHANTYMPRSFTDLVVQPQ